MAPFLTSFHLAAVPFAQHESERDWSLAEPRSQRILNCEVLLGAAKGDYRIHFTGRTLCVVDTFKCVPEPHATMLVLFVSQIATEGDGFQIHLHFHCVSPLWLSASFLPIHSTLSETAVRPLSAERSRLLKSHFIRFF
jgi:hypothetical protein